ncbi:MAG: MlaE family lipid ABC transporter permease subunit [Marinicaulis sp.]|nr:MlaE family lipid ABC transporter permease subunit [Marinicaulis sp.]NNE41787.1 MlaE family lipid ABC transporter permease subunit [Marinicaulis sp.]NNL89181.1 MlaE family lipid ABC transporter permease subunit [Marinicaulis sp.]
MAESAAHFDIDVDGGVLKLVASGDWRARFLKQIDNRLRDFADDSVGRDLVIDVSGVERLDTAGAMVLQRTFFACTQRTENSRIIGANDAHGALLAQVENHLAPCHVSPVHPNAFMEMLRRLGVGTMDAINAMLELMSFIGQTLFTAWRVLTRPSHFRWTSTVHHMEEAGLNAIPIIGLMSFLIGAVVAFMGAKILRLFNADIFTVELVGIAVLREFGVLLTAILIAGRSGSAFTAQIGSMKIREEIDAMRVLGIDPMEALVLPRVVALVIMLPAIAFIAAVLGVTGGALVAAGAMDISLALFAARFQETIIINHFWAGLIKAPFFAFVIGVIGCFQGMEVEGSSESLGQRTTLSVVQSLFLVIVIDAFFAMFYLEIDF